MGVLVELENDSMKNTQHVFRAKVTRHCRLACVKGAVFRGVVVSECQPVTSDGVGAIEFDEEMLIYLEKHPFT